MSEQFISEPIKPVIETISGGPLAGGAPSLPGEFIWRNKTIKITKILRTWRATGACRHGSGEQYARRFWFEAKTEKHGIVTVYFDKAQLGRVGEIGWYLFKMTPA